MNEYNHHLMTSSMATSSGFSDDCNSSNMDEDVINYLSTLTPHQQRLLDDFVSINDHTPINLNQSPLSSLYEVPEQTEQLQSAMPAVVKFAYGNSVGANHYLGRPVSMYEPRIDHEFNSLPPDLVSSADPNSCAEIDPIYFQKYSYEAEDAEYIETINEMRENLEYDNVTNDHHKVTCVADVHYDDSNLYATVQKPKKHQSQMITSCESTSAPPLEKFPKIMTQSCYGQLNNLTDMVWNNYEQDLREEDGNNHQIISSLMTTTTATTDSSIIDGISSINSSIYEQIPSMTSSIETAMTTATTRQRKIVKWWDDHIEHTEESLQNLHETAEEGECVLSNSLVLVK